MKIIANVNDNDYICISDFGKYKSERIKLLGDKKDSEEYVKS